MGAMALRPAWAITAPMESMESMESSHSLAAVSPQPPSAAENGGDVENHRFQCVPPSESWFEPVAGSSGHVTATETSLRAGLGQAVPSQGMWKVPRGAALPR